MCVCVCVCVCEVLKESIANNIHEHLKLVKCMRVRVEILWTLWKACRFEEGFPVRYGVSGSLLLSSLPLQDNSMRI